MSGRPLCICVEPFKREGVWFVNSELLLFQKAACSSTLCSCPSGGGAGEDLSACFCVIMLRSWAWFLWLHLYMEVHWALLLLSDAFLQGDDLGTHTHHPNGPPCASAAYFLQGRREQLNTNQTKASPKHYYPPRVYSQKSYPLKTSSKNNLIMTTLTKSQKLSPKITFKRFVTDWWKFLHSCI